MDLVNTRCDIRKTGFVSPIYTAKRAGFVNSIYVVKSVTFIDPIGTIEEKGLNSITQLTKY